jgi:endonuclease III
MAARTSVGAEVASELLRRYPRTYAEELGIDRLDRPSDLFRLLVLALLMSARIRASIAVDAAAALFRERWRTARAMADASWEARARTLNRAGYARYDERTSTMLGETSALLLDRYKGDLRRLREEAGQQPATERKLIKECKGIGDVGTDIFFREVQREWSELYPFADKRALQAAKRFGLAADARSLAELTSRGDFPRLINALVRADLEHVSLRGDKR